MYFCRCWFSNMVSFRYVLVFLNFLHDIFSIKFYTISFLCKHNFFIDEKHMQWMLDTKVKAFHESNSCSMKWPWNCISWNALKEKFQCLLPLYICVYMFVYSVYMFCVYLNQIINIYLLQIQLFYNVIEE